MTDMKERITRKDYSLVLVWAIGILILYII